MNRQTLTNKAIAHGAVALLGRNDVQSRALPVSSSIGFRTANPMWGFGAGLKVLLPCVSTGPRTELRSFAVLTINNVWLSLEWPMAIFTSERNGFHIFVICLAASYRRPGVQRRRPSDPVHPNSVVESEAPTRAIFLSVHQGRRYQHLLAADNALFDLAHVFTHGASIPQFAGSGTTGKVALELGRSAVLIELNPDYIKLIEKRCRVNLPLMFEAEQEIAAEAAA